MEVMVLTWPWADPPVSFTSLSTNFLEQYPNQFKYCSRVPALQEGSPLAKSPYNCRSPDDPTPDPNDNLLDASTISFNALSLSSEPYTMPSGEDIPSIIEFSDFVQVTDDPTEVVDPSLFGMTFNETDVVLPCQEM
jgi:hypothetical protein